MSFFGPYGPLDTDDIVALNAVAHFLALDDLSDKGLHNTPVFDLVVLAGNALLWTLEGAVKKARTTGAPLLISGGIGHSTPLLAAAVDAHPVYRKALAGQTSEARLLGDIAAMFLGLDQSRLLLEDASTNCGENGLFSRRFLDSIGFAPTSMLLVQDPLMQRRTDASFRQAWADAACPAITNWPVQVPRVGYRNNRIDFLQSPNSRKWTPERFLSLLAGEIQRLTDDQNGYGPRGKGFLPHVDIPDDVEAAWRHIMRSGKFDSSALRRTPGG
ncbi:YdcF family protein [Pleomorphomonas sp. PLEO]|uniref:YdcF family protein n=1 Tax=Pleomorphomonas sp. PLEO TaxID=3239306 RepID=UPI00351E73C1